MILAYIATTNFENILLSGLVGAVVVGAISLIGSFYIVRRTLGDTKEQRARDRLKNIQSGIYIPHVEPNGTMYIKNVSQEALTLKLRQQRLLVDLQGTNPDTVTRKRIYDGIAEGETKVFHPNDYATKLDKVTLGSEEVLFVPDCEMYGLVAETIREVLIATVLDFKTVDKELSFQRTYIHRFTMGDGVPEPRAAWTPIYSVSVKQ